MTGTGTTLVYLYSPRLLRVPVFYSLPAARNSVNNSEYIIPQSIKTTPLYKSYEILPPLHFNAIIYKNLIRTMKCCTRKYVINCTCREYAIDETTVENI